ncbi:MAG: ribosome-associated translation inhibitor RaiA [Gammaproteobacteria bacterium]|nr:ribosome-associated translation inhibitor RaiA [Gammaproteobacteria bacterium]MBP9729124.1 ribosome-associated translation inhibitor RaiA [Gammaproteobacteria bacterium]
MPIQITALHMELSDGLKNHVNEKFTRLERHFNQINHTHVTLTVDKKFQQIAKATMHLAGGKDIIASCTSEDLYASIDLLIDKLDEQIKKHKEKMQGQ